MQNWWKDRVGYQIYWRTFNDSNGDGMGDAQGIIEKLDYLSYLGVGAIWICPPYLTPDVDCGYDVQDYYQLDPRFGTMKDFDELLEEAHKRDIKVLLDIIPCHTSEKHEWFQKALADPHAPERNYYIFRDPKPDGSPPNNLLSMFGGSAWELDEKSGQYYLHMFYKEQPDLNWRDVNVRIHFRKILRFWLDKGIDGFRVDIAYGLYKGEQYTNKEPLADVTHKEDMSQFHRAHQKFFNQEITEFWYQPETPAVYKRWKTIFKENNAIFIGELAGASWHEIKEYCNPQGMDMVFFVDAVWLGWEPKKIVSMIQESKTMSLSRVAWTLSNHDDGRSMQRYLGVGKWAKNGEVTIRRAMNRTLAFTTFIYFLDGFPFLYQGEELGLPHGHVTDGVVRDPIAERFPEDGYDRDEIRTIIPWENKEKWQGFSDADEVWLPSEPREEKDCFDTQKEDENSPFHRYKELTGLRKEFEYVVCAPDEEKEWIIEEEFIGFKCKDLIVGFNTGESHYKLDPKDKPYKFVYSSVWPEKVNTEAVFINSLEFPPETTCVFKEMV
jgi:alpha-glucosidase